MEEVRKNSGQTLGIIALITAIITFVIAVIPCIGVIAIIPGIIAVVVSAIGLSHAQRRNEPRGVLVAGLVIGIIASLISFSQIFIAGKIAENAGDLPEGIRNIIEEVKTEVRQDLDDSDITIKIESGDDKIQIRTENKEDKDVKIRRLEELETGTPSDTLNPDR